jgi:hypothetical protein
VFGDDNQESFEEALRAMARKLGESIEHVVEGFDPNDVADKIGVDPTVAREWVESAGFWLKGQAETAGAEAARRMTGAKFPVANPDPLFSASPHPLDIPTDEQGLALAALESGRWAVEPVSSAIGAQGEGPRPSDTLGIVRELRVRDWITAGGDVTIVGRHALGRWLAAAPS